MKTNVFLSLIVVSAIFFTYISCKKDSPQVITTPCDPVCIVTGSYAGTYTNQLNQTAQFAFVLGNNNFLTGAGTLAVSPTSFGGYSIAIV